MRHIPKVPRKYKTTLPILAILFASLTWGSTFFITKDIIQNVPALDFISIRFALAGLIGGCFRFKYLKKIPLKVWKHGIILGFLYSCGQICQTLGIYYTSASTSGFITGMYVVFTPLALWIFFGQTVSRIIWGAVILACIGMMILSTATSGPLGGFGIGELLTLICALLYAFHIICMSRWAKRGIEIELSIIQMMVLGSVCTLFAVPDGITLPHTFSGWAATVYMALIAGLCALVAQTWAQSKIHPTKAAIIMATEPLFAAIFAVTLGNEHITSALIIGGSLIVGAMLLTETLPRWRTLRRRLLPLQQH